MTVPPKNQFDVIDMIRIINALSTEAPNAELRQRVADGWRDFLTKHFNFSSEQKGDLDRLSDDREEEVQRLVEETIGSKGGLRFVVVIVPDDSAHGGFYHELRRESAASEATSA